MLLDKCSVTECPNTACQSLLVKGIELPFCEECYLENECESPNTVLGNVGYNFCQVCQKPFLPTHKLQVFCSNGCGCQNFGLPVNADESINTLTLGQHRLDLK